MSNIINNKIVKYLYTLRYIKLLSYWSARRLADKLNQNNKQKYMYYYDFQVIYGSINKGLLLLLAGLALGILPQIFVVALSFIALRVFIGGLHFDSYTKCAWVSLISLITMALLSKYIPYINLINITIFLTLFCIILLYAPISHKNKMLNNNEKIKFKCISFTILLALYVIQMNINDNISNSIMYGILLSGIIALPICRKLSN